MGELPEVGHTAVLACSESYLMLDRRRPSRTLGTFAGLNFSARVVCACSHAFQKTSFATLIAFIAVGQPE